MCKASVKVFGICLRIPRWICGGIDGDGCLVYHNDINIIIIIIIIIYRTIPYPIYLLPQHHNQTR